MKFTTKQITLSALIAAIYAVLTIIFTPISFGMVQFRISEAFMLIAALTPAAIPGLFIGCILSNIYGGLGLIDIIFGSIATLLVAAITYYMGQKIPANLKVFKTMLLPLPTIIFNGLIVGGYLPFVVPEIRQLSESLTIVLFMSIGSVMLGELVITYALGIPLYLAIKKSRVLRFDEGL